MQDRISKVWVNKKLLILKSPAQDLKNTAQDFINLLIKFYTLNLSPFEKSPRFLIDSGKSRGIIIPRSQVQILPPQPQTPIHLYFQRFTTSHHTIKIY